MTTAPVPKLKTAGIQYHEEIVRTRNGGLSDADDPMSPTFVSPSDRTPMGSARWWALRSKGRQRPVMAVLDA